MAESLMTDEFPLVDALRKNLNRVIRGKSDPVDRLLTALVAGGHVLIEDVPGTGKTTLAKALAASMEARFVRIQFTPDLLPTDIVGGMVYSPADGTFSFRPGPIFANVILADEINRASPRTQSALLEAMSERQVTTEGETRALPSAFMVVATQNPVEYNGTYPLPEAQLDRFCMRISLGYPPESEEILLLSDQQTHHPLDALKPVADLADLAGAQRMVRNIDVETSVLEYVVRLIRRIRRDVRLTLGPSPRASLDLRRCAQAAALMAGRSQVRPEDVQGLAVAVLAHRLLVDVKVRHGGVTAEQVVEEALKAEPVPA